LRHHPNTRRLRACGATLSHTGRGTVRVRLAGNPYTRIGIST
jgi:hypothetical protein